MKTGKEEEDGKDGGRDKGKGNRRGGKEVANLKCHYWTGSLRFGKRRQHYWCFHTRARQRQDNDKTNVEPVHSYDAFHTAVADLV